MDRPCRVSVSKTTHVQNAVDDRAECVRAPKKATQQPTKLFWFDQMLRELAVF